MSFTHGMTRVDCVSISSVTKRDWNYMLRISTMFSNFVAKLAGREW